MQPLCNSVFQFSHPPLGPTGVLAPPERILYLELDVSIGYIFMVDNMQDCHRLIPMMNIFLPVRPTIIVTSFDVRPYHPVADLDPMEIIPIPINNHLLDESPLDF